MEDRIIEGLGIGKEDLGGLRKKDPVFQLDSQIHGLHYQ